MFQTQILNTFGSDDALSLAVKELKIPWTKSCIYFPHMQVTEGEWKTSCTVHSYDVIATKS